VGFCNKNRPIDAVKLKEGWLTFFGTLKFELPKMIIFKGITHSWSPENSRKKKLEFFQALTGG